MTFFIQMDNCVIITPFDWSAICFFPTLVQLLSLFAVNVDKMCFYSL